MLDNRVSSYAADRIDGAIDVADKYIEKYLPSEDQVDCKYSIKFDRSSFESIQTVEYSIESDSNIHEHEH